MSGVSRTLAIVSTWQHRSEARYAVTLRELQDQVAELLDMYEKDNAVVLAAAEVLVNKAAKVVERAARVAELRRLIERLQEEP